MRRPRVLVTGANGFIGSRLLTAVAGNRGVAAAAGIDLVRSSWTTDLPIHPIDLCDGKEIASFLNEFKPDAMVLNGAIKGLDACARSSRALAVNVFSHAPFIEYALKNGSHVVFISSDMVFGGCTGGPFDEWHPLKSNNAYGAMKIAGEQIVGIVPDHAIVRTALVCGTFSALETQEFRAAWLVGELQNQTHLPLWCACRALHGQQVRLASNVFSTPTFVDDLVKDLTSILLSRICGIFHCCGRERLSRFEMGRLSLRPLGLENRVTGFVLPVNDVRPLDVSLANTRTCTILNSEPIPMTEALRRTVTETPGLQ
jgi:dTDP-4-dehydrorhamnose reductase